MFNTAKINRPNLPFLFLFGRIILVFALLPNNLFGFGDYHTYFQVASLDGWPFLNHWVEYPPVFPFLMEIVYRLTGAQELFFGAALALIVSVAGAGSIEVFQSIASRLCGDEKGYRLTILYFAILTPLPYTWWYYDLIPVWLMLLGLKWMIDRSTKFEGAAIGSGILTKWFSALLLPALLRFRGWKAALKVALISIGMTAIVFGALYLISPEMTRASLISQPRRSSWETVWALIDGNYSTGEYILLDERTDASLAGYHRGNPARIPTLLTLAVFAGLGLWMFLRVRNQSNQSLIAFVGITWALFLMWSPGWSPQWILYLIPLILLTLPEKQSLTWATALVLLTIVEWPTMLARALFLSLWLIAPLRVIMLAGLAMKWYRITRIEGVNETSLASARADTLEKAELAS